MNIFYCWQSDTPSKIGKAFIRLALDEAVKDLSETMNFDEAERPIVDQDTQGVMGSPVIAETIVEKIRNSEVVVVDVTLVGRIPEGGEPMNGDSPQVKKLINSNVAYELGFAHGHHGHQRVLLKVMNTHYGPLEELPFDLKHRRKPVQFKLAPDATAAVRKKTMQALAKEFAGILQLYVEKRPPGKKHKPIPATANSAIYWQDNEVLVQSAISPHDNETLDLRYDNDQLLTYLRIWPNEPLEEFSGSDLGDLHLPSIEPLFGSRSGYSTDRNKYGAINYEYKGHGDLLATTQVFKNREIWGVEAYAINAGKYRDYGFDFLPIGAFESGLDRSLRQYLEVASDRFDYTGRIHVEAGLVNVKNLKLGMPQRYTPDYWGPIYKDVIVQTTVDNNEAENVNVALLEIFETVFDTAGAKRPDGLGFSPAPA